MNSMALDSGSKRRRYLSLKLQDISLIPKQNTADTARSESSSKIKRPRPSYPNLKRPLSVGDSLKRFTDPSRQAHIIATAHLSPRFIDDKQVQDSLGPAEVQKAVPKAPIAPQIVANRILNKMICDDPLSVSDLSRALPDVSKDSIQYVVDALSCLGVLVPLRLNVRVLTDDSQKSLGSAFGSVAQIATVHYSLNNFVKVAYPITIDLNDISEHLLISKSRVDAIRSRSNILKGLLKNEMNSEETLSEIKLVVADILKNDPTLDKDPLYQDLKKKLFHES